MGASFQSFRLKALMQMQGNGEYHLLFFGSSDLMVLTRPGSGHLFEAIAHRRGGKLFESAAL